MEDDRTELNNLAKKHPDKVKQIAAMWDAWAAEVGAPDPVKRGTTKKKSN
jgi:hypothetical protein